MTTESTLIRDGQRITVHSVSGHTDEMKEPSYVDDAGFRQPFQDGDRAEIIIKGTAFIITEVYEYRPDRLVRVDHQKRPRVIGE